jgi:hypothetical protein
MVGDVKLGKHTHTIRQAALPRYLLEALNSPLILSLILIFW